MAREPRNLSDLLSDPRSALGRLVASAEKRKSLIMQVKSCMEPDIATHLVGVNLQDDTLVILCDSAAWATRVRFSEDSLKAQLAERYDLRFDKLQVKVRAPDQP